MRRAGNGTVHNSLSYEGEIAAAAVEFGRAMAAAKARLGRNLTDGEILAVARELGYRKPEGPDGSADAGRDRVRPDEAGGDAGGGG